MDKTDQPEWLFGDVGPEQVEAAREQIARRHGFASFAELLDVSYALPLLPKDKGRGYVTRDPQGHWFVWEDPAALPLPADDED